MNRRILAALFLALSATVPASTAFAQRGGGEGARPENGEEINLAVGETKTISARDVKNYSEGVAGVIDIKLTTDASNFVLNGKRPGSTTLLLIRNDGSQITLNINVFIRSPNVVEKELGQLLENIAGVRVRRVGARIVIDGAVATEAEVRRVQQVSAMYPGQVEALVTVVGKDVVSGAIDERKYIIRIDFYFVQYDKNSSYAVGLAWPAAIGGDTIFQSSIQWDLLSGATKSATATLANQPIPHLDIAARKGWAKVMKQSTVITNNGVEANFQNGGEQLFPVNQGLTIGIQRVTFGSDVTVLPKYNPIKKDLDIRVVADVSDLTAAVSGTPLPGRITTKLTTNVSLKLGQSLVLSGIKTKSVTKSTNGLPILSEIPVLGVLFGSHSNADLETEGAIFVVPSVVATVPSSSAELVDTALSKFKNYDGNINTVNAYDKRPGGGVNVPAETK